MNMRTKSGYQIGEGLGYLYGYIFNEKGEYGPSIKLSIDPEQIASFLVRTRAAHYVRITNSSDQIELITLPGTNGYLDICRDQEYLKDLLEVLIPMQEGDIEACKLDLDISDSKVEWFNKTFGVDL